MGIGGRLMKRVREAMGIDRMENLQQLYPIDRECADFLRGPVREWGQVYGGRPSWRREDYHLNAAKLLCEYVAGLNTAELEIRVDGQGSAADRFVGAVLRDNAFERNMARAGELCEALGGVYLKPYNSGRRIMIDFVPAGAFYPISWDNRRFLEGVFCSELHRGERVYTRLEAHRLRDGLVSVENRLFERGARESGLGTEVDLGELEEFAALAPLAEFVREEPLFVHLAPAPANNLRVGCPLGLSRFANAVDTLRAADEAFREWQWERVDARKRILAPESWFRRRLDEEGRERVRFDRETRVYQMLDYQPLERQTPVVYAPDFQVERRLADLNAALNLLCVQTGLSTGAISFDPAQGGLRTATEVRSENSRTFQTVARNQRVLEEGLEELVRSLLFLAELPQFGLLEPGEHEVAVRFDDSVTPDRESYVAEGRELAARGLISRETFLRQYLAFTGEEAAAELERLRREGAETMRDRDEQANERERFADGR